MASVKIICRKDKINTEGLSPIVIRLTHKRRSKIVSTKIYVNHKSEWDDTNKKVKRGRHNAIRSNEQIHHLYCKVYELAIQLNEGRMHWEKINLDTVYELNAKIDFFQFGETLKEHLLIGNKIRTWKRYNTVINKLKNYRASGRLDFSDITVSFLTEYESHLKTIGNRTNTIHTNIKTIRAILYEAIRQGHLPQEKNPFFQFKLKKEKTEKQRPTETQLNKIIDLNINLTSSRLQLTKDMFLFSLYCAGIRAGDLLQLTPRNLTGNTLRYKMDKTEEPRTIAVIPQAKAILDRYNTTDDNSPLFPLLSSATLIGDKKQLFSRISSCNAMLNKNLKKIAAAAEIDIPLSMHMARHGFSELARKKGVSVYDISKALGHSSLVITENYLKSFDEDAMESTMNQIFG